MAYFPDPATMPRDTVEEGSILAPKFDEKGLVSVVTVHAETREVLMVAYANDEALAKTLETGEAHYWSRSRQELWHKGATSGQIQQVVEVRIDCDQDAVILRVLPQGDGGCCHVGYRHCFFRTILPDGSLKITETR